MTGINKMTHIKSILEGWDIESIRNDFPILQRIVNGSKLVYLDSAATAQKPVCVVKTIQQFYEQDNANVHRSIHHLSEQATQHFENSREQVRHFINAKSIQEVIFVRGTTEGINLVANSYGRANFQAGDEVIISQMEHHANIVPWQILRDQIGIILKIIPMSEKGELDLEAYIKLFSDKTKFVSIVHTSNALGTVNPIKDMVKTAHNHNVPVLVDGAQAVVHGKVDVQDLGCDFFVFSGHKLYGPTGIGAVYAKQTILETMPPYQGGGEMIEYVTFDKTTYAELPYRFEAGTPNIAGAIGMSAAINYVEGLGVENIAAYEKALLAYATQALSVVDGLHIIGQAEHKAPVISFVMDDIHALDIATIIDHNGIAIRSGHHCAMPAMAFFGLSASVRASFALYNTHAEVDALVVALQNAKKLLT